MVNGTESPEEALRDVSLLLTADEVARTLHVSRSRVYEWMAAGELPGVVKLGRSTRISRRALEQWVEERVAGSTAA